MINFKTLYFAIAIGLVSCLLLASDLLAQQFQMQGQFQVQRAGMGGLFGGDAETASSPDQMKNFLLLRIEEMQGVLSLDEKQTRQFGLAAKVVSKKVFEERNNPLLAPFGKAKALRTKESLSDEDTESAENQRNSMEKKLKELVLPVAVSTALNHKTWKKSRQSILTKQQQSDLEQHDQLRAKQVRDVAVKYRVWQLVEKLRLRQNQIEAISALVDRIEGDRLVSRLRQSGGDGMVIVAGGDQPKSITAEDLEDILTPQQMELFKDRGKGSGRFQGLRGAFGLGKPGDASDSNSSLGVQLETGLLVVKNVNEHSKADRMGIRAGDRIDEVNDKPVDTLFQIRNALKSKSDGRVSVTVIRDGESIRLEAK